MELMVVCPVFETVHDVLAGVGNVVGVTLLHVSESAAGVGAGLVLMVSPFATPPLPSSALKIQVESLPTHPASAMPLEEPFPLISPMSL